MWRLGLGSAPLMTHVLEPFRFASGVEARNRVALAALTNQQSHEDGSLSDDELGFLEQRAQGGFGIVCTCAAHVALGGRGFEGQLGVYDDALLPGLERLASALSAHGALPIVQLYHGGSRSPMRLTGQQSISASDVAFEADSDPPRAATPTELAELVDDFVAAAERCHRAGLAGVEIHGAHGYLFTQFLSTTTNRRTDEWGGSLRNRARLLLDVLEGIKRRVPTSFLVGVRLSPEGFAKVTGLDLAESIELAGWLAAAGADFLHLSLWDAFADSKQRPGQHPLPLFRDACPELPLLAAGKIWTLPDAERVLEHGADLVALGRAAICNPDWPRAATAPDFAPRRPPLSPEELAERGLSPRFVEYMRRWRDFVA